MRYPTLVLFLTLLVGGVASAHEDDSGTHPCHRLKVACENAGFKRGNKSKNLYKDCINPMLEGKTVGVTVSPVDVKTCKAKRTEHHKEHGK